MTTAATPNHALQRTATAVTARASAAAFPPTMHGPRQPPPSLSLGSLGVARTSPVKTAFTAFCFLTLVACANHSRTSTAPTPSRPIRDVTIGHWDNPFHRDPKLAGVVVQQFGECPYNQHLWEGKHPCEIYYYFWDGRVRQCGYEPDGTVREDFWWPNRLTPGDDRWSDVDFSHGSDPSFQHHADPRKKPKSRNA